MHLIEPIRSCIETALQRTGAGMKALIMDDATTAIVSAGFARSEILLREVYVFEQLCDVSKSDERHNYLNCIVIIRPTCDNIQLLCKELNQPHYRSYYIFFTFKIKPELVIKLAECDENEVVRCVKELSFDYQALTPFLFSLGLAHNETYDLTSNSWQQSALVRSAEGLASVLFALRLNPVVRYQTQSRLCKNLAERLTVQVRHESHTNTLWRKECPLDVSCQLIIVDRRADVITPIINSWTYLAMIHNQFGILNNRINLVDVPNRQTKDPQEMLLSIESDKFFAENYHRNYGEVVISLKQAVEDLKSKTSTQKQSMGTLGDMKKFIHEYPEAKRHASNVHNHVFLMGELTRIVSQNSLLALSECEQEIACGYALTSNNELLNAIRQLITCSEVRKLDAIRLVNLYSLYRSQSSAATRLITLLKTRKDINKFDVDTISQLNLFRLNKASKAKGINTSVDEVTNVTKKLVQNVKGVDNVLTQYQPSIAKLIDDTRKGKLKEVDYAFQNERLLSSHPPQRLIIFFVGGTTYDEALVADKVNRADDNMKIIVGGTNIHNSQSFLYQQQ